MSFNGEYFIASQLGGIDGPNNLAIDVTGAVNAPGTPIQVYDSKAGIFAGAAPPTTAQEADAANQMWEFVPVGDAFFIQSKLNSELVIDVTGNRGVAGTALQVWTKKPTTTSDELAAARNQLWTMVWVPYPQTGHLNLLEPGYQIQSELNPDLVIDVTGGADKSGTPLQVWTRKPTATVADVDAALNQLWNPASAVWLTPPK